MDPIKQYADTVVAEAIAAGKPKEEAEALRPAAEEEGRKIAAHPLFKGFEAHARKRFAEHDDLKKEVTPLKTAAQRLKDLEAKDQTEAEKAAARIAELEPKATRAEAMEKAIQGILDEATKDLTPEQKAVIVGDTPEAQLAHYRSLVAAGLLGAKKSKSPGDQLPGETSGALEITEAERARMSPAQRSAFYLKGGRVKG